MLTWVFIFLGAVGLTAVLILIGLAIATLEEICKRELSSKGGTNDSHINYFSFNYHSVGFI